MIPKNDFYRNNPNYRKVKCKYCQKEFGTCNIKRHEKYCYLNPTNLKQCPVCEEPIENYKTSETCSYSCSNTHFRSGESNPNWKQDSYRSTCFAYHNKKCIICDEDKIVSVHHVDENKKNNKPENLLPMCPTHHQYMHSRYRKLIQPKVDRYLSEFNSISL